MYKYAVCVVACAHHQLCFVFIRECYYALMINRDGERGKHYLLNIIVNLLTCWLSLRSTATRGAASLSCLYVIRLLI